MSLSRPVIVLVHGAWADASNWSSVISELQRRGFTVYAPPNPLRGLPQDSAYLHQFLTQNAALQILGALAGSPGTEAAPSGNNPCFT
jgi:pimeloyl-ACP methyl ester carboxylesterase